MPRIDGFKLAVEEHLSRDRFIQHQRHLLPEWPELKVEIARGTAVIDKNGNSEEIDAILDQRLEAPLFNVGSASKFLAVELLLNKAEIMGLDYKDLKFNITFDDIIEALWRGEIGHLIDNSELYGSLFLALGIDEVMKNKIIAASLAVEKDPNAFLGSILDQIKNGLLENERIAFLKIEIGFIEMMFFVLTVSSNASYMTLVRTLLDLYKNDPATSDRSLERLADLQSDLREQALIAEFEFIRPPEKHLQGRPNSTTPDQLAKAFKVFIERMIAQNNQEVLSALKNNLSVQECNFAVRFKQMQEKGEIPDDMDIYEKTGITIHIDFGKEFEKYKYPPHITFSTVFCIVKDGKVIATICHTKTIAALLPDPDHPEDYPVYIRDIKNIHLPGFIDEIEKIVRNLNLNSDLNATEG